MLYFSIEKEDFVPKRQTYGDIGASASNLSCGVRQITVGEAKLCIPYLLRDRQATEESYGDYIAPGGLETRGVFFRNRSSARHSRQERRLRSLKGQ